MIFWTWAILIEFLSCKRQKKATAQREVMAFDDDQDTTTSFPTKQVAEAWIRRVHRWYSVETLPTPLIGDFFPLPTS